MGLVSGRQTTGPTLVTSDELTDELFQTLSPLAERIGRDIKRIDRKLDLLLDGYTAVVETKESAPISDKLIIFVMEHPKATAESLGVHFEAKKDEENLNVFLDLHENIPKAKKEIRRAEGLMNRLYSNFVSDQSHQGQVNFVDEERQKIDDWYFNRQGIDQTNKYSKAIECLELLKNIAARRCNGTIDAIYDNHTLLPTIKEYRKEFWVYSERAKAVRPEDRIIKQYRNTIHGKIEQMIAK